VPEFVVVINGRLDGRHDQQIGQEGQRIAAVQALDVLEKNRVSAMGAAENSHWGLNNG
jgi:hypothetical protein